MDLEKSGRTALVCGSSASLGLACADVLMKSDWNNFWLTVQAQFCSTTMPVPVQSSFLIQIIRSGNRPWTEIKRHLWWWFRWFSQKWLSANLIESKTLHQQ